MKFTLFARVVRHRHVIIKTLSTVLVILVVFALGVQIGMRRGTVVVNDARSVLNSDFSPFWNAIQLIKDKYVDIKEVKDDDVLRGAISGAINSLKDPYTAYFPPTDAKKFSEDLNGSFGGIGAEIGVRNQQLVVIAPLKNNPAEKAGVLAGDVILKINDTVVTPDLSVEEAVKLIRGEAKTFVTLSLFRDVWKEAKEIKIMRDIVNVPTLDTTIKTIKTKDGKEINVAHIALYNFNANASSLFYQSALSSLLKGAKGIVLDLRNNPGGYLDVSVDIAGWFVKRGETVVRERFRSGDEHVFRATGNASLVELPVVVLVNSGSASASEILAGALRDLRNIKLVGEKTFGKGSVQEVENLKDGSTVKVTVAKWFTPNGFGIDKTGLVPDIEVKNDGEKNPSNDAQLEKALGVLASLF